MKRVVGICSVAAVLVALPAAHLAWGKAHVPLDRAQICRADGKVQNISIGNLQQKLEDGACRLTACVFNEPGGRQFVFMPGDACDPTDDGDGFCDATGSPAFIADNFPAALSAIDVTPACTNPF